MKGLDTERITAAALEVADRRGAKGFTIKAVAEVLGVTPMALYHHVENKAALVTLLVDKAIREQPLPTPSGTGWRHGILELARWSRRNMKAHPALAQLYIRYQAWTPASLALGEHWVGLWQQSDLEFAAALQGAILSSMSVLGVIQQEILFEDFEPPDESQLALLPNVRAMYRATLDDETFDLVVRSTVDGLYESLSSRKTPTPARRGKKGATSIPSGEALGLVSGPSRKDIMRKFSTLPFLLAILAAWCFQTDVSGAAMSAGSGAPDQGATSSAIRLGITYPDLSTLESQGLKLNGGNYNVAFKTVINNLNAHGGVNGRKIVPYIAPVDPVGTIPAAEACTKLTEDDHVFAVVGYFAPADTTCYLKTHGVPLIGLSLTTAQEAGDKAPWFNNLLSDDHVIPKELEEFNKLGVFKHHKVAVVGTSPDQQVQQSVVLPELKRLGVHVVQTAISDAPQTDIDAIYQQMGIISQKFSAAGADVVVAVGDAGAQWPEALQANHSTYLPRLVATSYFTLNGYTSNKNGDDPAVVKDAITATSEPPPNILWNDPRMKACVGMIQRAEPKDKIANPITSTSSTDESYFAPETACADMALFAAIAKAAGHTLNNATFQRGGESLTSITLPGSGGALHFGPGHHDGDGPVFVYKWDPVSKTLKAASSEG